MFMYSFRIVFISNSNISYHIQIIHISLYASYWYIQIIQIIHIFLNIWIEGEEFGMWHFVSAFGQLAQSIDFSTDSEKQKQLQACDLDKMLNNELEWLQTSILPTLANRYGQDQVNPLGLV